MLHLRLNTQKCMAGFKNKLLFLSGLGLGVVIVITLYQVSVYTSTDQYCMSCHVHPQADESWKQSVHMNNKSGTKVHCVDCHLPPKEHTWDHYASKLKAGIKDVWRYYTKDSAQFDWDGRSELEQAVTYIPNQSCKECHHNLLPQGVTDDAIIAHLYYEENEKKLDIHCISCHLDAGHYNPNYTHSKTIVDREVYRKADPSSYYRSATHVHQFEDFYEQLPGTPLSFKMIAIPGGTFQMGSPQHEPFRKEDESPLHSVAISPFFMSEVPVTWDLYWAFFLHTMSEGRTSPEVVFTNNSRPDVDAISGPTPPFGFPDQGWGGGDRPAITMTHYGAETFCLWLSRKTGKKYRLPTEAEWEYAARGGTETPYFFPGNPKDFSDKGFWRTLFHADTEPISTYVVYAKNSKNRTQEPSAVKANPFGLKNMLGNVLEYCADKYDPKAYSKRGDIAVNPISTEGTEWVVRGGNYASDAADLRCAARSFTKHDAWMKTDPQQPKSIWWYSDIRGIGFRIVCEEDILK